VRIVIEDLTAKSVKLKHMLALLETFYSHKVELIKEVKRDLNSYEKAVTTLYNSLGDYENSKLI